MLYSYQESISQYKSDYQIQKAIENGLFFKLEKGIYSDSKNESYLGIISKKYPEAILTMDSAFYFYGFTDTIPDYYCLATDRNASKIKDTRVKQFFISKELLGLGKVNEIENGNTIQIYNKERMLIELVRNKSKLPYDYYKEIIMCYRKIANNLDIQEIQELAFAFPKSNRIVKKLQDEVF